MKKLLLLLLLLSSCRTEMHRKIVKDSNGNLYYVKTAFIGDYTITPLDSVQLNKLRNDNIQR